MNPRKLITLSLMYAFLPSIYAQDFSFAELWQKVSSQNLTTQAHREEISASRFAISRTDRHWLPTLYVSGQGLVSNNPASIFFARLNQRSIEAADFVPADLNSPGFSPWLQANLGAQINLYQGRVSEFQALSLSHQISALEHATTADAQRKYATLASIYARAISLTHRQAELARLENALSYWRKRYRLGAQDNPVGYSGFLGIQTLDKNIEAWRIQTTLEQDALHSELLRLGADVPKNWKVNHHELSAFVKEQVPASHLSTTDTAAVMEMKSYAAMQKSVGDTAAKQFLPRVDAFVEGNSFLGDRDLGLSMTAGLMAKWNFFDPHKFKIGEEAQARARALELRAQDMALQSKHSLDQSLSSVEELLRALRTLQESGALLDKQIHVTQDLFNHGAVPIHSVMEVFHQKLMWVSTLSDTELRLAQSLQGAIASHSQFSPKKETL